MSRRRGDEERRTLRQRLAAMRGPLIRGTTSLLIVMALLSIGTRIYLATAWAPKDQVRMVSQSPPASYRFEQANSMRRIESALNVYRALHGAYPSELTTLLDEGDAGGIAPRDAALIRGAYYEVRGGSFVLLPPTR